MILLDSDVLMDFLKGRPVATHFIARSTAEGTRLATTTVTAAEVWHGAMRARRPSEKHAARQLLSGLPQIPFGPRAAERFGALMAALDAAGTPIPTTDGMIAAIALDAAAPIATRNIRHFGRVPELVVKTPTGPDGKEERP